MSPPVRDGVPMPWTELMALERTGRDTYRSIAQPYSPGHGRMTFGGHVYAQAAYAASKTVAKGFLIHNVTGHFLFPGSPTIPFIYKVRRIRDGKSYILRSVDVHQPSSGTPSSPNICFTLTVSFKRPETTALFTTHPPSHIPSQYASVLRNPDGQPLHPSSHPFAPGIDTPWWVRGVQDGDWQERDFPGVDVRKVDMKRYLSENGITQDRPDRHRQLSIYSLIGDVDEDSEEGSLNLHACAHIYASDRNSLFQVTTALEIADREDLSIAMASLCHSVVFHFSRGGDELKMTTEGKEGGRKKWFTQEAVIPVVADHRGMHESRIWDEDGVLVASTWQDGMVRVKKEADGVSRSGGAWTRGDRSEKKESKI